MSDEEIREFITKLNALFEDYGVELSADSDVTLFHSNKMIGYWPYMPLSHALFVRI